MSDFVSVTIPPVPSKAPSLFRLLARSRSRLSELERRRESSEEAARAFVEADQARLCGFGSWQAISAEMRKRAASTR